MTSSDDEDVQRYCICRSADSKTFMIACEKCDEWFHGKCIRITPEAAAHIKKYYCEVCRSKDSSLTIKYRKTKKPVPKQSRGPTSKSNKKKAAATNRKRPTQTKRRGSGSARKQELLYDVDSVQCLGPGCVNPALTQSKYCSDACGLTLAARRLAEIMPKRLEQWQQSSCEAERNDKQALADIKRKQQECQKRIELLTEKHKVIDKIVERGKTMTVAKVETSESENGDDEGDDDEEMEEDLELFVYCVTCGHEVRQTNAFKHMQRCYTKVEKDMIFENSVKSPGNYICDHYNTSTKSYCKRLKQICPEHARDGKILDSEVCGCPLTNNIYQDTDFELCQDAKKNCNKHFRWERLRRAEIDGEIIREYYRWEELAEKERLHTVAMANRGGVLSLMLHQTVDHEALSQHNAWPKAPHRVTPMKPEKQPDTKPPPTSAASKVIIVQPPATHSKLPVTHSQPPVTLSQSHYTISHSKPPVKVTKPNSKTPIIVSHQGPIQNRPIRVPVTNSKTRFSQPAIIALPSKPRNRPLIIELPDSSKPRHIQPTPIQPNNRTSIPRIVTPQIRVVGPASASSIVVSPVNPVTEEMNARRKSLAQEHSYFAH